MAVSLHSEQALLKAVPLAVSGEGRRTAAAKAGTAPSSAKWDGSFMPSEMGLQMEESEGTAARWGFLKPSETQPLLYDCPMMRHSCLISLISKGDRAGTYHHF